jgi:hypothetical protein
VVEKEVKRVIGRPSRGTLTGDSYSVMTLVLPEPGPARMNWKPQVVTASVCEGLRGIEQYLAGKPVMLFEKMMGSRAYPYDEQGILSLFVPETCRSID